MPQCIHKCIPSPGSLTPRFCLSLIQRWGKSHLNSKSPDRLNVVAQLWACLIHTKSNGFRRENSSLAHLLQHIVSRWWGCCSPPLTEQPRVVSLPRAIGHPRSPTPTGVCPNHPSVERPGCRHSLHLLMKLDHCAKKSNEAGGEQVNRRLIV